MMENYSLSDIKSAIGDNNGFGNGGGDMLLILILFLFFNQNGFGQHGFGGAATAAAQNELLLGQNFDRIGAKLDDIAHGQCDSTYALNNSIKDCCCNTQLGIAHLDAKIDQQTGVFTAMLKDMENQRLRDRVGSLELDRAMCGVVRYPMQMSYCTPCSPFCGNQNGCGYGCGNGF